MIRRLYEIVVSDGCEAKRDMHTFTQATTLDQGLFPCLGSASDVIGLLPDGVVGVVGWPIDRG